MEAEDPSPNAGLTNAGMLGNSTHMPAGNWLAAIMVMVSGASNVGPPGIKVIVANHQGLYQSDGIAQGRYQAAARLENGTLKISARSAMKSFNGLAGSRSRAAL